jgi:hypothetical protein
MFRSVTRLYCKARHAVPVHLSRSSLCPLCALWFNLLFFALIRHSALITSFAQFLALSMFEQMFERLFTISIVSMLRFPTGMDGRIPQDL